MDYTDEFKLLKKAYKNDVPEIRVPELGIKISKINFSSRNYGLFHNNADGKHNNNLFTALLKYYLSKNTFTNKYFFRVLDASDEEINENKNFQYLLLQKENETKSNKVIILFHGLNERSWEKYLPWATELNRITGKAVLFFPIAFHMNRAPVFWSNPRLMSEVAKERQALFPDIIDNSFANTAISIRLSYSPKRFLVSGLQTYHDVLRLVKEIKNDEHLMISSNAGIDIFSYSMGAFLGEMLMMINSGNYFDNSKLFIFCGGPTLDLMAPVSRAIIDSEADSALRNYFMNNFLEKINDDKILREYFTKHRNETEYLKSFLQYENNRILREERLSELKDQISILALVKDKVIPATGISKTFENFKTKLSHIEYLNFEHKYSHENPFPVSEKERAIIDLNFKYTFKLAGGFLS